MICIQERNISRRLKFTNSELNCMLPKILPKCLLPLKVQKSGCPDPQCRVLVPNVPLNLHRSRILVADARIRLEPVHSRSPPPLQYGSHRASPRAWFSGSHIVHLPPSSPIWEPPSPIKELALGLTCTSPLIVHLLTPSSHILHPHASPACFPIARKYDALRCKCLNCLLHLQYFVLDF